MDMARAPWRPTATATWQSYPFNFHKHSESEKKKSNWENQMLRITVMSQWQEVE